jgi:hypothetical protein
MKMPGFTAEASLYQTSGYYRMVATGALSSDLVLPAAIGDRCKHICRVCAVTNDEDVCDACEA